MSDNEQNMFKGYSLGAVDYMTKPFHPEIFRSKVRFFIKLFWQNEEIKRQAVLLEKSNTLLDAINIELEGRVAERTAELESANRELEREVIVHNNPEERLAVEHGIPHVLADAASLERAASPILKAFREFFEADLCLLWLLDQMESNLFCSYVDRSDLSKVTVYSSRNR